VLAHMHANTTAQWRGHQHDVWEPATAFFVGRGAVRGQLHGEPGPFTFPRQALPASAPTWGPSTRQLGRSFRPRYAVVEQRAPPSGTADTGTTCKYSTVYGRVQY